MKTFSLLSSSLLVSSALVMGGCPQEEDDSPSLPHVGSIAMDLNALTSAPDFAKTGASTADGDHTNFANAYTRVAIVDLIAKAIIVLPAAAIVLAVNQRATQLEDGSFHWTVTALGSTADVFVDHSFTGGWDGQLFITNADHDNYLWVEGDFTTALDQGRWTIHDPALPAGDDVGLEIDWEHRAAADFTLTYRNANQLHDGFGDTMAFTLVGTDASLVYDDVSEPNQVATILWDTVTAVGSMQVPEFNEGQESCWDANYVNASCR